MDNVILDKLNEMDRKLDDLLTWKAVHQAEHETVSRDIVEVRGVLFDNPGLKSQVQTLMNCKSNILYSKNFWMSILKVIIAAAIVAVAAWLIGVFKKGN